MVLNKIDYTSEYKYKLKEDKKLPKTLLYQFNEKAKKLKLKYRIKEMIYGWNNKERLFLIKPKSFLQRCSSRLLAIFSIGVIEYSNYFYFCEIIETKGTYTLSGIHIELLNKIKQILIKLPFNFEVKINQGTIPKNYAMLNELEKSKDGEGDE